MRMSVSLFVGVWVGVNLCVCVDGYRMHGVCSGLHSARRLGEGCTMHGQARACARAHERERETLAFSAGTMRAYTDSGEQVHAPSALSQRPTPPLLQTPTPYTVRVSKCMATGPRRVWMGTYRMRWRQDSASIKKGGGLQVIYVCARGRCRPSRQGRR
jgi:hypothetical protein